MDQVNRPLLIALLATAVLAAGWMAFMRPGAVQTATEEVTAPAQVATQARQAADATEKAAAATDKATAEAPTATPPPAQATPVTTAEKAQATPAPKVDEAKAKPAAKADPQAVVLKEMDAGKVVVLLFWDRSGADDRAARDAVRDLDLRGGKVAVHLVDTKDVGRFESVTQGVTVAQSPTTMVIVDGTARSIAGLSEPTEVDQLVREALAKK